MYKKWTVRKHDHNAAAALAAELNVSKLAAALLIARGFETPEKASQFINPSQQHIHDPSLLLGMTEAADRIEKAISDGEKILIWGDYDVDGTTGTVLLRSALKLLGGATSFHIPDRFSEGYGVNIPGLEKARLDGCSLAITVDCGIRSFEPARWAKENGFDLIITDHHLSDPVNGNPDAFAVVNPNQPGCCYPDKNLAGVGVAFKLAHELLRRRGKDHLVPAFLKIAAIGTVADIMKLIGENRAIVAIGLKDVPRTKNFGLRALMEAAGCDSEMTSMDIGFRIGPRINAAGRMDLGRAVIELFEAENFSQARRLAEMLDSRNRERQQVQQKVTADALFQAADEDRSFIVVTGEKWHRGVIGLAASRVAEKLGRPTIVFSIENGIAHGSGRSVGNYHLLDALESCSGLFEQFGGHAAAAGMTIKSENIDELSRQLNAHAAAAFADLDMTPELLIDASVSTETLDLKMVREIAKFEPFGAGNPRPVFMTRGLFITGPPRVMKEKHLKLILSDERGKRFEAVWWDGVERSTGRTLDAGSCIELAYTAEENVWQGSSRLQLIVEDLREENSIRA
ncbi:MAG: single-stranded-DNA-specific exonuclease RecJ [Acidobacteriota bacterium]